MAVEFPRALLREATHSWNLVGTVISPGVTTQSVATLVRTDGGGFWTCNMSEIALSGRNGISMARRDSAQKATLLWRAIRQIANGGVSPLIVPRNDAIFRPWPEGLPQGSVIDVPHGDGTLFLDDGGYYQSAIDITSDAAALRATSLDITINVAGDLVGGESFSIQHGTMDWRLYEISTVEYADESHATITFNPPLREAITSKTVLEFDRPRCKMRLAAANSMDLAVNPQSFNTASVDFIESP